MPKKTERGEPLGFFNIYYIAKHQKIEGGPSVKKNFEKKLTVPNKTERGDSLVCPGIVCYAEKEEKTFRFSSLGQTYQFGAINLCRTCRTILVSSCGLKKEKKSL